MYINTVYRDNGHLCFIFTSFTLVVRINFKLGKFQFSSYYFFFNATVPGQIQEGIKLLESVKGQK